LDWGYVDGTNRDLFRKFGFKYEDQPTFFALDKPNTGNFYKQKLRYNLTNFEEISERFKKGVET
jgi:hypothetical protein